MRIVDTTNLGNTTPAQTGRAAELRSIDSGGKAGSVSKKGSATADSVQLSGFADRIAQTMQDAAVSRAQRVSELTAAVRSGSYQVDAKAVSHDIVSQAIASGSNEHS